MRRVSYLVFRYLAAIVLAILIWPALAGAARLDEYSSRDDVLRWVDGYRLRPEPAAVRTAMKVLSERGALRDPEAAGVYAGFLAGIIGAHPAEAERIVGQVLAALPSEDHWIVVRAIAYSGLPEWKALLSTFAPRMPSRAVMIERYLDGKLLPLDEVPWAAKQPGMWDKLQSYFSKEAPRHSELTFDSNPELLDTLWGIYFATGDYRPVARIIAMLPWSKEKDVVARLTLGNMAKYTLVTNATRSSDLLAMLKRASWHQPPAVTPILDEVVDAAETLESSRIRQEALALIEDLKTKGPGYRRELSLWSKVGEGTLAVGCIAAAASGMVALGLPCVIGGATTSAALHALDDGK